MLFRNKLDAHTFAGPGMIGSTNSSSSDDDDALVENTHSLTAEPISSGRRGLEDSQCHICK